MVSLKDFAGCLALALVLKSANCSPVELNPNINVLTVRNLTEFFDTNPSAKIISPLIKETSIKGPKIIFDYRLGNRINGDRLIASGANGQTWSVPQDIKLTLNYPTSGIGSVLTFIQIRIEQSSNLGGGFVTSGGIGQRQVTIVIEAKQTLYFRYEANFFGY